MLKPIEHITLSIGKSMAPYDMSEHFSISEAVYSIYNEPTWLVMDYMTGVIKGVPFEENYSTGIIITAKNDIEEEHSNPFSIYTRDKPTYVGGAPAKMDLVVGVPLNTSVSHYFSGATSYTLENAPKWLKIDKYGNLYGIPYKAEVITDFRIIAENVAGTVSSGDLTLNIITNIHFRYEISDIYCEMGKLYKKDITDYFITGGIKTTYEIWNAPAWMTINSKGKISGTPDTNYITKNIVVVAKNVSGTAMSNVFIVQSVNIPRFVRDISNITNILGTPITPYDISEYVEGEHIQYTLQHAPDWMDIDNNGIITGTSNKDKCVFGILVIAQNIAGRAISNTFNVEVSSMPVFSGNINNKLAIVDKVIYPFDVSPYFNAGGTPRSYKLNGAPHWLSITNFGILKGTPKIADAKETQGITIIGTNFVGSATSDTFNVSVFTLPIFKYTISNMFLAVGKSMMSYNSFIHFESGAEVLKYSLENAPNWMRIDSKTGYIRGVPTYKKIYDNIRIVAEGKYGIIKSNIFSCEAVEKPVFTGMINDIKILASNILEPIDISHHFSTVSNYRLEGEPSWIKISNIGVIYGTPFPGIDEYYKIKVIGFNIAGNTSSNEFILDVDAIPLLVEDVNNIEVAIGRAFTLDISANFNKADVTPDAFEFIQAAPDWLSINNKGVISGTPDDRFATCSVSIKAENRAGSAISNKFSLRAVSTPLFVGNIPDMYLQTGVEMTPYDLYQHFNRENGTMVFTIDNKPSWLYVDMDKLMGVPEHE